MLQDITVQHMLELSPKAPGHVELRRGQPLDMQTLHELLHVEEVQVHQ